MGVNPILFISKKEEILPLNLLVASGFVEPTSVLQIYITDASNYGVKWYCRVVQEFRFKIPQRQETAYFPFSADKQDAIRNACNPGIPGACFVILLELTYNHSTQGMFV